MATDWNEVWSGAIGAAKKAIGPGITRAVAYLQQVSEGHRAALESITRARLEKKIDQETFEFEMNSEQMLFGAELLALKVVGKATAEAAANAFIGVISQALAAGINGLI